MDLSLFPSGALDLNASFHVPIFIINYNQLYIMKEMVSKFASFGYKNIYIVDNASSYPPLLEYYENCAATVIRMGENYGYQVMYKSGMVDKLQDRYFVMTDPDLRFAETFPATFVFDFYEMLQSCFKPAETVKIGPALRIDNLPDKYTLKKKVIKWESQFWVYEWLADSPAYLAPIDTTLALYPPHFSSKPSSFKSQSVHKAIRVAGKYVVEHAPWYFKTLPDDFEYYAKIKSWKLEKTKSAGWVV